MNTHRTVGLILTALLSLTLLTGLPAPLRAAQAATRTAGWNLDA